MSYNKYLEVNPYAVIENKCYGIFTYKHLEKSNAVSRKREKKETASFPSTPVDFSDLTLDSEECTDLYEYQPAPKLFKKEPNHEFVDAALKHPGVFKFSDNIKLITPEVYLDLTAMDVDESVEDAAHRSHIDTHDTDESLILCIDEPCQDRTNLQSEMFSFSNPELLNCAQKPNMHSGDNSNSVYVYESPINLVCHQRKLSPRKVSHGSSGILSTCEKLSLSDSLDIHLAINRKTLPISHQDATTIKYDSILNEVNMYEEETVLVQFTNKLKRSYMTNLNARLEADSSKFANKVNMARAHGHSAVNRSDSRRKHSKMHRDSMRLRYIEEKSHLQSAVDNHNADDSLTLRIDRPCQNKVNFQSGVVSFSDFRMPNSDHKVTMNSGKNSHSVFAYESAMNLVRDKKKQDPRNVSCGSSGIYSSYEEMCLGTSIEIHSALNRKTFPISHQDAMTIERDSIQNDVYKYAGKLLLAQFSKKLKRSYMTKLNARLEADSGKFEYKTNMARAHDDSAIKRSESSRKNVNLNAKLHRDSMRLRDIEGDLLCKHLEEAKLVLLNVKSMKDLYKLLFESNDFL